MADIEETTAIAGRCKPGEPLPDGFEIQDVDPQPNCWPICPTCDTPYRRSLALQWTTGRRLWTWTRDCKHRSDPELEYDDALTQTEGAA